MSKLMRIALDTNIMAYAEGLGDTKRCNMARSLIKKLPIERVVIPAQTLGELYRVLIGKAGISSDSARATVLSWADSFYVVDSTWTAFKSAFDLATDHELSIWDALIMAISAENHCRILLSEDFQSGFTWHGVTVVNPFSKTMMKKYGLKYFLLT